MISPAPDRQTPWELHSSSITRERRLRAIGRRVADACTLAYRGTVRVLQLPAVAFDLLDRNNRPDYSKVLPFIASQELAFALLYDMIKRERAPSIGIALTIGSLSFGWAGWRMFLEQRSATVRAMNIRKDLSINLEDTRRLLDERDPVTGEPPRSMRAGAEAIR